MLAHYHVYKTSKGYNLGGVVLAVPQQCIFIQYTLYILSLFYMNRAGDIEHPHVYIVCTLQLSREPIVYSC